MNISNQIIIEAVQISGGLYSMNASRADGYAFCATDDGTEIAVGEFVYGSELGDEYLKNRGYEGVVVFKSKTIYEVDSGETKDISHLH